MAEVTLKGTPTHTYGDLPAINTHAPEFHLRDFELNVVSLANFAGKKKLLSVVPSLDTPVCAQSTKYFHAHMQNKSNCVLLVISADLPFAQKRFCETEHLSDVKTLSLMNNPQFAKDYGLLLIDGPLKGLTARAVFVLDEKNKILYHQLVQEITAEPNYEQALSHL